MICTVYIIRETSAVSMVFLASLQSIPMLLASILCAHAQASPWNVVGFAVCIAGALVYFDARVQEKRSAENTAVKQCAYATFPKCAEQVDELKCESYHGTVPDGSKGGP